MRALSGYSYIFRFMIYINFLNIILTLEAQRGEDPIFYQGQLHNHYFWFLRDSALCDRFGINRNNPVWPLIPYDYFCSQFAEYQSLEMPVSALSGILIYHSHVLSSSNCLNLDMLVKLAQVLAGALTVTDGNRDKRNGHMGLDRKGKWKATDDGDEIISCKMCSPPPNFPTITQDKVDRKHAKKLAKLPKELPRKLTRKLP